LVGGLADEFALIARFQPWVFDGEELPLVRDAFERMGAPIGEWDARTTHQVGDGAGDEDFAGLGECLDALGDVDGDAPDIVTVQLDFAGMEPNPHIDTDGAHRVADGTGAAHGSPRPVEGRQEPVAGRLDLSAAEAFKFGAGEAVVGGE
jgi:hypothetical protein